MITISSELAGFKHYQLRSIQSSELCWFSSSVFNFFCEKYFNADDQL